MPRMRHDQVRNPKATLLLPNTAAYFALCGACVALAVTVCCCPMPISHVQVRGKPRFENGAERQPGQAFFSFPCHFPLHHPEPTMPLLCPPPLP